MNFEILLSVLSTFILPIIPSNVTQEFVLPKTNTEERTRSSLNWNYNTSDKQYWNKNTTFILQVNNRIKDNKIQDKSIKRMNKLPKKIQRSQSTEDVAKTNARKHNLKERIRVITEPMSKKNNKLFIQNREYREVKKCYETNGTKYDKCQSNKYDFDKSNNNYAYSSENVFLNSNSSKVKHENIYRSENKKRNSFARKKLVNLLYKTKNKRCSDEEQTYDYFEKPWNEIDYLYKDGDKMSINCMKNRTNSQLDGEMSKHILRNDELAEDMVLQYVYDETLLRSPTGGHNRMELYNGEQAVYMPAVVFMLRGHLKLQMTTDRMQVAVDAFAIIFYGSVQDVLRLPPAYVLASARTISLMLISREKFEAMWIVVKAGRHPRQVPLHTLEIFRPLFGYIPTHDLQQLNFIQNRYIMKYIGTHSDLTRHKAGVIAMRIHAEWRWKTAKSINTMMGLICGFPVSILRTLSISIFLQLDQAIFYHIHACEAIQRQFLLAAMTSTEVLGKSQSWHASDVMRLGFLIMDINAEDLRVIDPKAMVGLSTKVILKMPQTTLLYITKQQYEGLNSKQRMLLGRMLKSYRQLQDTTAHDTTRRYNQQIPIFNNRFGGLFQTL